MTPERKQRRIDARVVGERIRLCRAILGVSADDLAQRGITRASLSRIENGRCFPSVPMLSVLANRFGVTFDLLLLGECQPPRIGRPPKPKE